MYNDSLIIASKSSGSEVDFHYWSGGWDDVPSLMMEKWSPILFAHEYRNNANFLQTDLLALDFDKNYKMKQVYDDFAGYAFIIGPTKSHLLSKNGEEPCEKFRLVLRFEHTITDPNQYTQNYKKWASKFGADMACSNSGRHFYACKEIEDTASGAMIPVDPLIETNKVIRFRSEIKLDLPNTRNIRRLLKGEANGASGTGRHELLRNSAADLYFARWEDDETLRFLCNYTNYSLKEMIHLVKSVFNYWKLQEQQRNLYV